jgi:2-keto-4-pentenoate hydratase
MDAGEVGEAADALRRAYEHGVPVSPPTAGNPGLSLDDGYAIQQAQVTTWTGAGGVVKGYKVGLTSAATRQQFGAAQSIFGVLLDSMFLPEGDAAPFSRFLQPKAELEIAFVLGRRLAGPGVTVAEALAAVDFVLPALEFVDSRVAGRAIALADIVADNAFAGAVALGSRPVRPFELDLSLTGGLLRRDGVIVGTGAGGAVFGSPVNALVWLANALGAQGVALEPGHVILPGSVCAAVPFGPGDTVSAAFDRIGTVSITFTDQ